MEHPVKEIRHVVRQLTQGTPEEQRSAVYRYFVADASFVHPFCRVPPFRDLHIPGLGDFDSRALIVAILKWYRILSPKIELEVESCAFDQRTSTLYVRISQVFSIWFIPFHRAPVTLVSVLHLAPYYTSGSASSSNGRIAVSTTTTAAAHEDAHAPPSSPPPPQQQPYDAAQEKLHAVQQGAEPSYASVASGAAAPASHNHPHPHPHPHPPHHHHHDPHPAAPADGPVDRDAATPAARPALYYIRKQEDLYQVTDFVKFVSLAPGAGAAAALQLLATAACLVGVVLLGPLLRAVWPSKAAAARGGIGAGAGAGGGGGGKEGRKVV